MANQAPRRSANWVFRLGVLLCVLGLPAFYLNEAVPIPNALAILLNVGPALVAFGYVLRAMPPAPTFRSRASVASLAVLTGAGMLGVTLAVTGSVVRDLTVVGDAVRLGQRAEVTVIEPYCRPLESHAIQCDHTRCWFPSSAKGGRHRPGYCDEAVWQVDDRTQRGRIHLRSEDIRSHSALITGVRLSAFVRGDQAYSVGLVGSVEAWAKAVWPFWARLSMWFLPVGLLIVVAGLGTARFQSQRHQQQGQGETVATPVAGRRVGRWPRGSAKRRRIRRRRH